MVNRLTIKYWCIRGTAGQVDLPVGQPIFMMKSPNRAGEFFSVIVSLSLFLRFYSLSFDSVLQNGFVFSTDQQTSMSYLPWEFYQHYKDCTLSVCDWVLAFWSANQKICWIEITQHITKNLQLCGRVISVKLFFKHGSNTHSFLSALQNKQFSKCGNWVTEFK